MEASDLTRQLDEFRLIDAVDVHIVGEKPGDASGQAVHLELAARKEIAVLLAQTVGADRAKKGRKLGIRLAVLLGEITDRGIEVAPSARGIGKRRAVIFVLAFRFGAHVLVAANHRWKLEKVADENGLQPAKGIIRFADELANLADRG